MEKAQMLKQMDFFINSMEKSDDEIYLRVTKELFAFIKSQTEIANNIFEGKFDQWVNKLSTIKTYSDFPDTVNELKELAYVSHKISTLGTEDEKKKILYNLNSSIPTALKKYNIYHLRCAINDIVSSIKGKVFIIHGHDTSILQEVTILFLRTGIEHVILKDEQDFGRTIIEKLLDESDKVCFAIALLTPDDILVDGSRRARQNVILEIGYFLGKLGKNNIRLIVKDDLEIPSDLQGVLYLRYDAAGAWRYKLLNEIKKSTNLNPDLGKI